MFVASIGSLPGRCRINCGMAIMFCVMLGEPGCNEFQNASQSRFAVGDIPRLGARIVARCGPVRTDAYRLVASGSGNHPRIGRAGLDDEFRARRSDRPSRHPYRRSAAQVARVKQLLCETTMTPEQITPLAGYSHKERLSAVFKRETGATPGEYRRQKMS